MSVTARVIPVFPSSVVGDNGITVTKANGVYTIALTADLSSGAMVDQNFIINGSMETAQLNGSNSVAVSFAGGSYTIKKTVDRWLYECRGSAAVTLQQVADAPAGMTKSLKLSVTTVQASMGAPDSCTIFQFIELANFARAGFGAAGALPITFFFFVKAHRTGQYGGTFKNELGNRVWGFHYTINRADTWEYKTVTVQGDTTGSWTSGGNLGAFFMLSQATGSTLGSCRDGDWGTTNGSNVSGSVNAIASLNDTFQVTGVGAIIGSRAPAEADAPKLLRPQHEELIKCRRFLRREAAPMLKGSTVNTTLAARMSKELYPPMRVKPSLYMFGNLTVVAGDALDTVTSLGNNYSDTDFIEVHMNTLGTLVANRPCQTYRDVNVGDNTTANYLIVDAEYFNNLATP